MRALAISTLALTAALAVSACSPPGEVSYSDDAVDVELISPVPASGPKEVPAAEAAMAPTEETAAAAAADSASADSTPAEIPTGAQIAYSYDYGIEVPSDQAVTLMRRHEAACTTAGPSVCQVLAADSRRHGRDSVSARLELRAAPAWLATFRAGLEGDAEAAGGRLAMASTESEDLTRSLTDTAARVRALTTLRDRLERLLATRSAPLDQLLATERELARVQGELDATQSALTAMRTRVAMSHVSLRYESAREFAPDSAFTPVARAFTGSVAAFMSTLGAIIYLFAGLLPILLIVVPLIWAGWKHRRKIRLRKSGTTPAPSPEDRKG